jgi:hypothetical protein
MIRATPRNLGLAAILLAAFASIPYCAQSRVDRAAVDRADGDAAGARDAARRAQESAAEAAEAAKAARHAVDDIRPRDGPGS